MIINFDELIEEIQKISSFDEDFKKELINSVDNDDIKKDITKTTDMYLNAIEKTTLEQAAKDNNIQKQQNKFLSSRKISLEDFLKDDFKIEDYVQPVTKNKKPQLENCFFFEKKEMGDNSIINRYSITYYTEKCLDYLSEKIAKKMFFETMFKNESFIIHLDIPKEYKKLCINKIVNHILDYGIICEQNIEKIIEILPGFIQFKEVRPKTINTVYKECRKKYL